MLNYYTLGMFLIYGILCIGIIAGCIWLGCYLWARFTPLDKEQMHKANIHLHALAQLQDKAREEVRKLGKRELAELRKRWGSSTINNLL